MSITYGKITSETDELNFSRDIQTFIKLRISNIAYGYIHPNLLLITTIVVLIAMVTGTIYKISNDFTVLLFKKPRKSQRYKT